MSRRTAIGLAVVPVLFLLAFFVWPVASILATGLVEEGGKAFTRVLTNERLLGVAWFTLWQAVVSTVLTVLVAMPATWVLARFDFRGRSLVRAVATVPFVLPTVVVGTAFLALVGPSGVLGVDLHGTVWAILGAHVFFNIAVVVRVVGGVWGHLDPRLEDAARSLGASPWQTFTRVTLPLLRPALAAASSIVFLFTLTSFGTVLILGGPRIATVEVEIYRRSALFLDLPAAAVLALLQMVGVVAALTAYSRYQERHTVEQTLRPVQETARRIQTGRERGLVAGILGGTGVIVIGPPLVLVWRSLTAGGGFGLQAYRALRSDALVPVGAAVGNSLGFAVAATLIALGVGLPAAVLIAARRGRISRWFDTLLMLPLGTSAVTIGFGFLIALDSPVDLRASRALVPIAHALVATPFVVRASVPVLRAVRGRLREAAATLGASPARTFREVDLPIVSRVAAVGAAFAFAVSLGEFGATIFLARPGGPTIPIAIYRFLGRPGVLNFGQAMALSVLLMAITAAAIMAVERARFPGPGAF
ncbi:MAG: iron ABC transporter permease [Actinomycetota bacterium]|nr:iron ABC transporter permease [Actinomycetota bacterium]